MHKTEESVYLLTASHVIRDVGNPLLVDGQKAEVVASSDPQSLDLALLRVDHPLTVEPLSFARSEAPDSSIKILGYGYRTRGAYAKRPLEGKLGQFTPLSFDGLAHRVPAWDIHAVREDDEFQRLLDGYSGSPICTAEDERVIGVVTHRVGGDRGYATSVDALLYETLQWHRTEDPVRQWLLQALASRFHACFLHGTSDGPTALSYSKRLRADGIRVWPPDHGRHCAPPVEQFETTVVIIGGDGLDALDHTVLSRALKHPQRIVKAVLEGADLEGAEKIDPFGSAPEVCLGPDRRGIEELLEALRGPRESPPCPPPPDLERLLDRVARRGLTLFVGPALEDDGPSAPSTLTRELLSKLAIPVPEHGVLPPLDYVGMLYAANKTKTGLEEDVVGLLKSRCMLEPSPVYRQLGQVVRRLAELADRSPSVPPPLIVTTNLDLMIEIALVEADIPFCRLVYYPSKRELRLAQVSLAKADRLRREGDLVECINALPSTRIKLKETEQPDDLDIAQPLLFKYHGSDGVADSCTLSTHEYHRLQYWRVRLPEDLNGMIRHANCLFVGYRKLDATFQQLYQGLLADQFHGSERDRLFVENVSHREDPYDRFAGQAAQGRDVRRTLLMQDVDTLRWEGHMNDFLEDLASRLSKA